MKTLTLADYICKTCTAASEPKQCLCKTLATVEEDYAPSEMRSRHYLILGLIGMIAAIVLAVGLARVMA